MKKLFVVLVALASVVPAVLVAVNQLVVNQLVVNQLVVANELPEKVRMSCFCIKRNGIDPEFVPTAWASEVVSPHEKITCNSDDAETYLVVVNKMNIKELPPVVFRFPAGRYKLSENRLGLVVPELEK